MLIYRQCWESGTVCLLWWESRTVCPLCWSTGSAGGLGWFVFYDGSLGRFVFYVDLQAVLGVWDGLSFMLIYRECWESRTVCLLRWESRTVCLLCWSTGSAGSLGRFVFYIDLQVVLGVSDGLSFMLIYRQCWESRTVCLLWWESRTVCLLCWSTGSAGGLGWFVFYDGSLGRFVFYVDLQVVLGVQDGLSFMLIYRQCWESRTVCLLWWESTTVCLLCWSTGSAGSLGRFVFYVDLQVVLGV